MRTPALLSILALTTLSACGSVPGDSPAPSGCPVVSDASPTMHPSSIERSETWTAAGSPHIVQGDTRLSEGATLTIEPCARVVFRADASLTLMRPNTRLVAEGTEGVKVNTPIAVLVEEGESAASAPKAEAPEASTAGT